MEIVQLLFNQVAENVNNGQIDAGLILEPFETKALQQFPDLIDFGDASAEWLPEGTPTSGITTSAPTLENKPELIAAFRTAYRRSLEYGAEHLDEVRALGAEAAGIDPGMASATPGWPRPSRWSRLIRRRSPSSSWRHSCRDCRITVGSRASSTSRSI